MAFQYIKPGGGGRIPEPFEPEIQESKVKVGPIVLASLKAISDVGSMKVKHDARKTLNKGFFNKEAYTYKNIDNETFPMLQPKESKGMFDYVLSNYKDKIELWDMITSTEKKYRTLERLFWDEVYKLDAKHRYSTQFTKRGQYQKLN